MGRAVQPHAHYKPWLNLTAEQSPDKTPTTTSSTITLDPIPSLAGCVGMGARASPPASRGSWLCNPGLSRVRARARRQHNAARLRRVHAACVPEQLSQGPPPMPTPALPRRALLHNLGARLVRDCRLAREPRHNVSPFSCRHRAAFFVPCLCLSRSLLAAPDHRRLLLACSPALANSAGFGSTHTLKRGVAASNHSHVALPRNSHTFKTMPLLAAP
jgi:hypothetical protein